eukprot:SAG11_NODE_969_length_6347_cov_13.010871_4_plen_169_part_00
MVYLLIFANTTYHSCHVQLYHAHAYQRTAQLGQTCEAHADKGDNKIGRSRHGEARALKGPQPHLAKHSTWVPKRPLVKDFLHCFVATSQAQPLPPGCPGPIRRHHSHATGGSGTGVRHFGSGPAGAAIGGECAMSPLVPATPAALISRPCPSSSDKNSRPFERRVVGD